jgi:ABC-type transport system involved in cytochrome c biogenesis ATPase subunit
MTAALALRDVHKTLRAGTRSCFAQVRVLRGLSLCVAEGEMVSIVGPPASGKTVLLLCAAGLMRPDAGTIRWCGREIRAGSNVCRYLAASELVRDAVPARVRALLVDDAGAVDQEPLRAALHSARQRGLSVVLCSAFPVPRPLNLSRRYELKDGMLSTRAMVVNRVAECARG